MPLIYLMMFIGAMTAIAGAALCGLAMWAGAMSTSGAPDEVRAVRGVGVFICVVGCVIFMAAWFSKPAHAADLQLPIEITHGRSRGESMGLGAFGIYSTQYMRRRWARLCKGGGRYQAMAEAYERGLPSPCRSN